MLDCPAVPAADSDPPAEAECFHFPAILFKVGFGTLGGRGFATFLDRGEVPEESDMTFSIGHRLCLDVRIDMRNRGLE